MKSDGKRSGRKSLKAVFRVVPGGEEVKEPTKVSRQKYEPKGPDDSLKHLQVELPDFGEAAKWSEAMSMNTAISDLTKVKCYVCGGSGHFIEICPMYAAIDDRFAVHGLRKCLWGRAIN